MDYCEWCGVAANFRCLCGTFLCFPHRHGEPVRMSVGDWTIRLSSLAFEGLPLWKTPPNSCPRCVAVSATRNGPEVLGSRFQGRPDWMAAAVIADHARRHQPLQPVSDWFDEWRVEGPWFSDERSDHELARAIATFASGSSTIWRTRTKPERTTVAVFLHDDLQTSGDGYSPRGRSGEIDRSGTLWERAQNGRAFISGREKIKLVQHDDVSWSDKPASFRIGRLTSALTAVDVVPQAMD